MLMLELKKKKIFFDHSVCRPACVKWILPSYSKIGLNWLLSVVTALLFIRGMISEDKIQVAEEYRKLLCGQ